MRVSISSSSIKKPKTLKMTDEDFQSMAQAVLAVVKKHPQAYAEYKAKGLSDQRYNWDVLRASVWFTGDTMNRMYSYLNDSHINAAVAAVLGNSGKASAK